MSLVVSAARANLVLGPIGFLLAVATSVLIARWLGPHTFADYATLLAVLWLLTLLGECGCNVGFQRYLAEAAGACARLRFYWVLQLRRWCVASALTVAVVVLGPVWAARAELPAALWGPVTFGLVGVLAGLTLHSQLAASGLLATFNHARAMTVANSMSVFRAAALGVCLYLFPGADRSCCRFACSHAYRSGSSSLVCRAGFWAGALAVATGNSECGATPRPGCDR